MAKVLAIGCIDSRHSGKLSHELAKHLGCNEADIYVIRIGGGLGNLASLRGDRTLGLLKDVDLAIRRAGVTRIVGMIHGVCDHDLGGCAAYIDEGYGEHFGTVEANNVFVLSELVKALHSLDEWLAEKGYVSVTTEALPVTFGSQKENILGEAVQMHQHAHA